MRPCAINFKAKLIRGFVSQERKTQHKTKLNSNNRITHASIHTHIYSQRHTHSEAHINIRHSVQEPKPCSAYNQTELTQRNTNELCEKSVKKATTITSQPNESTNIKNRKNRK